MEKKDLIKKLEEVKTPQVEMPGHKTRLKATLTDWYYRQRKLDGALIFKRGLIPATSLVIILMIVLAANIFISPQNTLAQAMKITMENPQVRSLINENNAEIKEIKIIDNKAYALITSKIPTGTEKPETEKLFAGALIEISLKDKRVSKIEKIAPKTLPLTSKQEEEAKTIIKNLEPQGSIEFEKIESLPVPSYNLKLIEKDKEIEISIEQELTEAQIIYKVDSEIKLEKIDLGK